ncbi:LPS export ABC transporter periplasmic protein LptC [Endozoicomonas sp. OPT23]|uniref:LPS export ABC transporter periplasmic protein LptC n=1 Tax=Endozoicomonas sp. OPT23 TaxID=2072845 RepID=UPI00129ACD7B|nr:LPS export ABC transporter periplasmic protein LptC [Endozoicomonas sp. OPT23]MRI34125.1 LPS export ABC transporter periplasmic protein LptC [Endozoicomonas sp. OPT23]
MPNRNSLLLALLLLTLVGAGYWSYDSGLNIVPQKKAAAIRKNADYYLLNADVTQYNAQGSLSYTLNAKAITHYPHNDTTLVQLPHLENFSNPKKRVVADALNGKMLPGNLDIELWDKVVLTETTKQNGKQQRMDTDFLTIYSKKALAVTNQPVLITSPTGTTRAIGMEAYYNQGLVKLKSRVRGNHTPQQ